MSAYEPLAAWTLPPRASRPVVPDETEQAVRRVRFQDAHPEVVMDRVGGKAQATIPAGDGGSRTITRDRWRDVLDVMFPPDG